MIKDMIKALVVIRESTKYQEIDAQRIEAIAYAKTFGYSDDELMVIGSVGASAIKLDDRYLNNMKKVYNALDSIPTIERVVAVMLDRIARDEVVFVKFKNILIEKKINLNIKNPSLFLLDENGQVNNGMEVAIGMFCVLSKQEMDIKKARFKIAKKHNAELGKFNGGLEHYGYTKDENGYIVINEEEAKVIRLVFDLYASNEYSVMSLQKELDERGYKFTWAQLRRMLSNKTFIGGTFKDTKFLKGYPRIVDADIFKKCQEIKKQNMSTKSKESVNHTFASKILRCPFCGRYYCYQSNRSTGTYVCIAHKHFSHLGVEKCEDSISVNCETIDAALVYAAKDTYTKYLFDLNNTSIKEINEKLSVLNTKIDAANIDLKKFQLGMERLQDDYYDGSIEEARYQKKKAEINAKIENTNSRISSYQEDIKMLEVSLADLNGATDEENEDRCLSIMFDVDYKNDIEYLNNLIHKYIKVAYITQQIEYNNRTLTVFHVINRLNKVYTFLYDCRERTKASKLIQLHSKGYTPIKKVGQNLTLFLQRLTEDDLNKIRKMITPLNEKLFNVKY